MRLTGPTRQGQAEVTSPRSSIPQGLGQELVLRRAPQPPPPDDRDVPQRFRVLDRYEPDPRARRPTEPRDQCHHVEPADQFELVLVLTDLPVLRGDPAEPGEHVLEPPVADGAR